MIIEAVIFDMDGVLIDSEPFWREAETEVFGGVGVGLTEAMLDETMGMRVGDVVDHWFRLKPWTGPMRQEVARRILEGVIEAVRSRGTIMPGALEAIALFERAGLRLALASSSPRALIDAALAAGALAGRFEVVHSAEEEPLGKPHPGVYLSAAAKLGAPPGGCLAIEDSPAGVRAARAAGMVCVAVPTRRNKKAVQDAGANVMLASLEDLDDGIWAELDATPRPAMTPRQAAPDEEDAT